MNFKMKNWFLPQWITNICLLILLLTMYKTKYVLMGSVRYGGITVFTIIATPIIIFGHLHNFGLRPDMEWDEFLIRFLPGIAVVLAEMLFVILLAFVLGQHIYWNQILVFLLTIIMYTVSGIVCFSKVETKSIDYSEYEEYKSSMEE